MKHSKWNTLGMGWAKLSARLAFVALFIAMFAGGANAMVISEFMAINDTTLADSDGDYSDWIELHNPSGAAVNLAGWFLTDDAADLDKWELPAVTVPAGGYVVIFASDKDRADLAQPHTNFKLGGGGEYLALLQPNFTIAHEFAPTYPAQNADVSYGLADVNDPASTQYFSAPTPGATNNAGFAGYVEPVQFSVQRGFFDTPFSMTLSTATAGATILYSTDGSDPTSFGGNTRPYTAPIAITDTTVVRAFALKAGCEPSESISHTYIFLDSVLAQGNNQLARNFPDTWYAGASDKYTYDRRLRVADYEMDSQIVTDPVWGPQMEEALTSIPTISLSMDVFDLFDPNTGIYPNSIMRAANDPQWEKAASMELIDPAGGDEFCINAGARIFGELARWPAVNDKQSFRIVFQEEWGPTKLKTDFFGDPDVDEYDTIILRSHWGQSWLRDPKRGDETGITWLGGDLYRTQYLRDQFGHDAFGLTGNLTVRGRFVHLYLNGVYWGLYQMLERPDNSFNAEHQGGDKEDYNVIKGRVGGFEKTNGALQDGSRAAWDWLFHTYFNADASGTNQTGRNTISDADLAVIAQYIDIDNFIDYMITLWTINRGDFPKKNWYAVAKGGGAGTPPEIPFRFYVWDSEASLFENDWPHVIDRWNEPSASNDTGPVRIYWRLVTNPAFRMRWADRAAELLTGDGPMTGARLAQAYAARAAEIEMAILGESARWGDWSADYHDNPMNKNHWVAERDRLVNDWLPARPKATLDEMCQWGMYPSIEAPIFLNKGQQPVQMGSDFSIANPNPSGDIWYTLDGTDPRLPDGSLSPSAMLLVTPAAGEVGWEYLDDGQCAGLGDEWKMPGFMSGWEVGNAELGYGDGDEATLIGFGDDTQNKPITTLFRRSFPVGDVASITELNIDLLADDGAMVYLNGQLIIRQNMPDGDVTFDTPALTSVVRDAEKVFTSYTLAGADLAVALGALVEGENVMAVEVHQDSPTGSDLSFNMHVDGVSFAGMASSGVGLMEDTVVTARVLDSATGEWSTVSAVRYAIDIPPALAITEVDYHPADPTAAEIAAGFDNADDFEFIEVKAMADVLQIGAVLDGGIDAVVDFSLAGGAYGVFVKDVDAFQMRYGVGINILGVYDGSLNNAGERVILQASNGTVLADFTYDDQSPWPTDADGRGATLNLAEGMPANDPVNWIAGEPTPGADFMAVAAVEGDFNGDGVVDATDIDLLREAIMAASVDVRFDLDGDNFVSEADLDYLVGVILDTVYGDANLDGAVDLTDFVVVKQNFGQAVGWAGGNFDLDANVSLEDFVTLKCNFGCTR